MTHPAHTIFENITDTVSRIQRLHGLVEFYLPMVQQYQCISYNEFKSLSTPKLISSDK